MTQEIDLNNIDLWRTELGLLPVPLYPGRVHGPQPYVMMNGSRGNFCLAADGVDAGADPRSIAWSSNVSHFVSMQGEYVEVQRWDQRKSGTERYTSNSVRQNLNKFHEYLERDAVTQDVSIVLHAIRIFRRLRAAVGSSHDGPAALNAYLVLLACTTDNVDRDGLVADYWRLAPGAREVASTISDVTWNSLRDELLHGRKVDKLEAYLKLLLRHAAGQLFQEAHYEAVFMPSIQQELELPGITPAPVGINRLDSNVGIHFTPPALARTIVEQSLGDTNGPLLVFDPACGSGEFLRETLRQLEMRRYTGTAKVVGWDLSRAACDMARFVLAWEKRNSQLTADIDIRCVDSVNPDERWPAEVDNVFMNPPFISWQDMEKSQKAAVHAILGSLREKAPDLSHAFLLKAAGSLKLGGVLGAILPASLLDGQSASKLRESLGRMLSPRLIARLGSQTLFPNASIDAAFYVAERGATTQGSIAFWSDHRASSNAAGLRTLRRLRQGNTPGSYPFLGDGFSIYLNPKTADASWAPRPYEAWRLLQTLRYLPRVHDVFDVNQGVRTGRNPCFVLKKEVWNKLPKREREYFKPAVVNQSIRSGVLTDSTYIFYPYGDMTLQDEEKLQERLPIYYLKYLAPSKAELQRRAKTNKEMWWKLTWPRSERIASTPKLVSTYFGGAGSFAWDGAGEFVVVQGYSWLPRRGHVLSEEAACAYLAILNSGLFAVLLSASANNVSGGQWNLSTRFVSDIAIPNLLDDRGDLDSITNLAVLGKQVHDGLSIDTDRRDELVRRVYGIIEGL